MSSSFNVKLPSKRITATDKETIGNNNGPNSASGSSKLKTGPTNIPTINRNNIAGNLVHQANH